MTARLRRPHCFRAAFAAIAVTGLLAFLAVPAAAQPPPGTVCGGTPDCPQDPMPPFGLLPPVSTEISPDGDFLVVDNPLGPPNPALCFEASGPIAGVSLIDLGNVSETQLFTQAPSIDVVSAGRVLPFPLAGSTLQCGGVVCLPGIGEAVAVTDEAVGSVFGSELRQHALPSGASPVSAAGIGTCLDGSYTFTLCVETTAPSIQCAFLGESFEVALPGPLAATPESFTNGEISGVVAFTDTTAQVISGGAVAAQPLGGVYVSHTTVPGGLEVTVVDPLTMTPTTTLVPLPPGASVVAFGPCATPLDSCPTPSGSQIAMNLGPCDAMDAASTGWPITGAQCQSRSILLAGGGPTSCPPPPPIGDKRARVCAWAETTLDPGAPDVQCRAARIWIAGSPGTPGNVDGCVSALAFSIQAGTPIVDYAAAYAELCADYDPAKCTLRVTPTTVRLVAVGHDMGHVSRAATLTVDPVLYEPWPAGDELVVDLRLPEGFAIPLPSLPGRSAQGRMQLTMGTNLPGFATLWTSRIDARFDGTATDLQVDFVSNPALDLDDAAVAAALGAALVYNPSLQAYEVLSEIVPVTVGLEVPTGIERVIVTQTHATANEVFEPGAAADFRGWCGDGIVEPALGEECELPGIGLCGEGCRPIANPPSDWLFRGISEGGEIRFVLRGLEFVIPLLAGETAAEVTRRIAAEVAAHPFLAGEVDVLVLGGRILLGEPVTDSVVDDRGLFHVRIPTLSRMGILVLFLALLLAGWWVQRRSRTIPMQP